MPLKCPSGTLYPPFSVAPDRTPKKQASSDPAFEFQKSAQYALVESKQLLGGLDGLNER